MFHYRVRKSAQLQGIVLQGFLQHLEDNLSMSPANSFPTTSENGSKIDQNSKVEA